MEEFVWGAADADAETFLTLWNRTPYSQVVLVACLRNKKQRVMLTAEVDPSKL